MEGANTKEASSPCPFIATPAAQCQFKQVIESSWWAHVGRTYGTHAQHCVVEADNGLALADSEFKWLVCATCELAVHILAPDMARYWW